MNLNEAIKSRRSIRFFQKKKVVRKVILKIIEAANYAPSACNRQDWHFIVIDNQKKLKRITEEGGAYFIKDAPLAILVLYKNITDNVEYQDYVQSAAAAIQNMHLKITSLGLGSCWVANLPHKNTLRKIFKIPFHYDPIALIVVGYPRFKAKTIPRLYALKEMISFNDFTESKEIGNKRFFYKIQLRKFLRQIFFSLPLKFKKIFLPLARKFEKREF